MCVAQKKMLRNEETLSGTQTINSCCSLDYARGNESIICFTNLCKLIETYYYARKMHPFASYPTAKHPKHSKNIRQKPLKFFSNTARASTLALTTILKIPVPLQKFPFLFISIIPWYVLSGFKAVKSFAVSCAYDERSFMIS